MSYEGKYVRLVTPIPNYDDLLVGDICWRKSTGVDMTQANGWVYDVWVCTEDGHEHRLPDKYRSHFELVEDME
jgi:hypothetical protein